MSTDTSRSLEIEGSRWQLLGLLAGGIVLTVASAAIALQWIAVSWDTIGAVVAGSFGFVFFGLCTAVALWRLITSHGPVVTIAPQGIRDTRVAAEFIPWSAVTQVSTWQYRNQMSMVLAVDPATEARLHLRPIARWTRSANRSLGADGLCITAVGLKIDYPTLLQTSLDYMNAARRRA